ncbi:hypothetical protein COCOR_04700 [Corallococcus coralloides DSM 2259]|uniref:Lipoprotein n=1 Tax=Corallococcus coralloides (strain ATCC 25202 / DSM 2259 / NBRC 100086 / M2) TaxID=1144275 RepID=H8MJH0_CORCM|nr:hypothetical protein [Corallococcus coralloides]AFE05971.1 hypothetical protein COCOR_04700 [Corallococcus coralloides DSM 2259]
MRFMPTAALVFAASLATACGGPLEEAPRTADADVAEESIASQEQAIDESCVNSTVVLAQPDGAAVTAVFPTCGYQDASAASTDGSYDQTECPHRFVTEVTGLAGNFAQPFVEVIPASTVNESACKGVAIGGAAFGYKNGAWYGLGSVTTTGTWIPPGLFFPNGFCVLRFNIGSGGTGYSKMRVTGFGAALGVFKTRVRTGVRLGTSSC